MENTRVCKKCNIEKGLNVENFYKTDGIYFEWTCRECRNEEKRERRQRKKGITENKGYETHNVKYNMDNSNNIIKSEVESEYEIIKPKKEMEYKPMNLFNDDEVKIIKSLIGRHNDIMAVINNKIELNKIEDIKIKKSISISEKIHNKVLEVSNKSNLNYSQVIESLLKKALESI